MLHFTSDMPHPSILQMAEAQQQAWRRSTWGLLPPRLRRVQSKIQHKLGCRNIPTHEQFGLDLQIADKETSLRSPVQIAKSGIE